MSGRIRTVKPELLDDAVTAGLSDAAFRLFIAVILLSDDHGRFRAEPRWLRGQVYWSRDISGPALTAALDELVPLVLFYSVHGQSYGEIRNWSKHQKIDHPGKPKVPAPPEVSAETLARVSRDSREIPETLATDQDQDQDQDQDPLVVDGPSEVWEHYVAVVKRHRPRRRPGLLSADDRKKIAGKLKTFSVEDLKAACEGLFRSPHHLGANDQGKEYLEIEYALRKPAGMIALAEANAPPPATAPPPPPVGEYVDAGALDALLEGIGGAA